MSTALFGLTAPGFQFLNQSTLVQMNGSTPYVWMTQGGFQAGYFIGTGLEFQAVINGGNSGGSGITWTIDGIDYSPTLTVGFNTIVAGLAEGRHEFQVYVASGTPLNIPAGGGANGNQYAAYRVTGAAPAFGGPAAGAGTMIAVIDQSLVPSPAIDYSAGFAAIGTGFTSYTQQTARCDASARVVGKIADLSIVTYCTGGVVTLSIEGVPYQNVTLPSTNRFQLVQIGSGLDPATLHSYEVSMSAVGSNVAFYVTAIATSASGIIFTSQPSSGGGVGVNSFVGSILTNRKRSLHIGTSLTFGNQATGLTSGSWVSLLRGALGNQYSVANYGQPGSTLDASLAGIEAELSSSTWSARQPDVITLEYLSNDAAQSGSSGETTTTYGNDVKSAINYLHSRFPLAKIIVFTGLYRGDTATATIDAFNAVLVSAYQLTANLNDTLFNFQSIIIGPPTYTDLLNDKIHLTQSANAKTAQAVAGIIQPMFSGGGFGLSLAGFSLVSTLYHLLDDKDDEEEAF